MLTSAFIKLLHLKPKTMKPLCRLCNTKINLVKQEPKAQLQVIDARNSQDDSFIDNLDVKEEPRSVLEECREDISHIAPYLKPTYNFASYVNKSETLQQLVKLGVNLHKLERKKDVPGMILGLDFERDIKKYLRLLDDLKVEDIGAFLTKNPFIFKEDIDQLVVRVNYLRFKRFTDEMITRIVSRNPYWLLFSTQKIDERLGFFQKEFELSGQEVRLLASKQPKLITYRMQSIKINTFVIKEEMGFTAEEVKKILLNKPNLFMKAQTFMLNTFEYIHNTMKIPLETIVEMPDILTCREFRVRQRHMFLETLGKAQYKPKLPNYVSPLTLVSGTDSQFVIDVAKSSIQAFNTFLKSM